MKRLLTLEQAAEITQVPVVTLRRRCACGDIRATKPNGSWRIYEDSLEEWLRKYEPRVEPGVQRSESALTLVGTTPDKAWTLRAVGGKT